MEIQFPHTTITQYFRFLFFFNVYVWDKRVSLKFRNEIILRT